jgi:hypothetical protein
MILSCYPNYQALGLENSQMEYFLMLVSTNVEFTAPLDTGKIDTYHDK